MSQKEFAKKTGIRESTISDWKNKHTNPSSDKIMTICDVLEISPYALLSGTDENYNKLDYIIIDKNSEEYYLIDIFRNLPADQQKRLLGYAEALKN